LLARVMKRNMGSFFNHDEEKVQEIPLGG